MTFCRVLTTDVEIEHFVDNVLHIDSEVEKRRAINAIADAERNIRGYDEQPTLTHFGFRDFKYRDEKSREKLRRKILKELMFNSRLDNDDKVKLGKGGAAPKTDAQKGKKVYFIIGPPASGKSGVSNIIADAEGAYILDSDYAKRKLPEFSNQVGGASLVHRESDAIIFSLRDGNLQDFCIENDYNIIIPKIGYNSKGIIDLSTFFRSHGYSVYLISVDLDRTKATLRAYERFRSTKRYVPLSLIFDGYANEPTLNYFRLKQQNINLFDGFAQITTDVNRDKPPILVEQINIESFRELFGGELYG